MYKVSINIKILSFSLLILGLLGIGYGFYSAPKSIEESKEIIASQGYASHNSTDYHSSDSSDSSDSSHSYGYDSHEKSHDEHVYHQLANRPWAALYVAAFFFFMISLGTLAFYAIQRASQAGWSPVLFRVMEGITGYLLPGGLLVLIILVFSVLHFNHLFIWMDPEVVEYDKIIKAKSGYLEPYFFLTRGFIYLAGWSVYRYISRRFSIAQDNSNNNNYHIKNFKLSAGFLVFFLVTESMMSWDWIMSIDPHWFSTLFGWYVFASMAVSGITTIALISIYLKSKGYLPNVNDNHIHDLGKFMFGFSVFWTYLWFSQFMLIWYSNIPEEVVYFISRIEDYSLPFWGMVIINFVLPFMILVSSNFKRVSWIITMAGIIILVGHYIDVYNMIMPSAVGDQWGFGVPELGSLMFFGGLFLITVFYSLTKAPLEAKGDPFNEESKKFVYPF